MSTAPPGNRAPDLLPIENPWFLGHLQAKPLRQRVLLCEGIARLRPRLRPANPLQLASRPLGRLICPRSRLVSLQVLCQRLVRLLPADSKLQSLVLVEVQKPKRAELQIYDLVEHRNRVQVALQKSNCLVFGLDKRAFLQRYP